MHITVEIWLRYRCLSIFWRPCFASPEYRSPLIWSTLAACRILNKVDCTLFWSCLLSFCYELKGFYVSQKIVLFGPSIHIICHFVGTEVRNQNFLWFYHKLNTSQSFKIFENNQSVFLGKTFLLILKLLGIGVDLSSRRGKFHISATDELMMLCLDEDWCTICNEYELIIPNNQFASSSTPHAIEDLILKALRVEGREVEESLV